MEKEMVCFSCLQKISSNRLLNTREQRNGKVLSETAYMYTNHTNKFI